MSSAGPAEKAEARNRGARIAVIQNGRAARPEYRKAVTVWMLTAQGIDRMMIGLIQLRRRDALRLGRQGHPADEDVEHQVAAEGHHVPEHQRVGRG